MSPAEIRPSGRLLSDCGDRAFLVACEPFSAGMIHHPPGSVHSRGKGDIECHGLLLVQRYLNTDACQLWDGLLIVYPASMDIGLTPQQRIILRCARSKGLRGAERSQVLLPLWAIAVATLAPVLLIHHPGRYVLLLVIPLLGLRQRKRVEHRIAEWALDLREI